MEEERTLSIIKPDATKRSITGKINNLIEEAGLRITAQKVQVLEGKDAISLYRNVMGSTNPKNADEGTIRAKYAESIEANSVHGSDSKENASKEINFFFKLNEIVG